MQTRLGIGSLVVALLAAVTALLSANSFPSFLPFYLAVAAVAALCNGICLVRGAIRPGIVLPFHLSNVAFILLTLYYLVIIVTGVLEHVRMGTASFAVYLDTAAYAAIPLGVVALYAIILRSRL
jgi:hypothetical protein